MVFSTVIFLLLFLPLAFAGAWLAGTLSRKLSNAVLLGASLVFYFWGEKWGVGWLVASVVFNWLAALAIQKVRGKSRPWDKAIVAVAIVANLAFLGYFKYASWLSALMSRCRLE